MTQLPELYTRIVNEFVLFEVTTQGHTPMNVDSNYVLGWPPIRSDFPAIRSDWTERGSG